MPDPAQPKKLTYREFSTAHESIAHIHQVCQMATLACSILACGVLMIPATGKPPVYVRPVQFSVSLMWGLVFVCSEADDYLPYVLGRPSHARHRIFDVLFRRYQEDCDKMHRFPNGLNDADFVGTGFEKLKGNRNQFTSVSIWGKWADGAAGGAYVRGWVGPYARMFPGYGWEEGSVPRPIGMPDSSNGPDIFSDEWSVLSEIPRSFRYEHWEEIQRAETWWRMVFEASHAELQAGEVRTWARDHRLWKVAPFVAVPVAAPVAVPAVAPVVAPAAASGSDSESDSGSESGSDSGSGSGSDSGSGSGSARAAAPRRGGTEASGRSETAAPELRAMDGRATQARETRRERSGHAGVRALIDKTRGGSGR